VKQAQNSLFFYGYFDMQHLRPWSCSSTEIPWVEHGPSWDNWSRPFKDGNLWDSSSETTKCLLVHECEM